jgi:hypothetical protein
MSEITYDEICEYVKISGAHQVWMRWRDTMLRQGRPVDPKYMEWPIPERDIELDAMIARSVIADFLIWRMARSEQKQLVDPDTTSGDRDHVQRN